MKELIIKKIKGSKDLWLFEMGADFRFTFYFKNCDAKNSLIFFALFCFDEFTIKFPADYFFWGSFIDFINDSFGTKKRIHFTGEFEHINKKLGSCLFYSGGKDSFYSSLLLKGVRKVQWVSNINNVIRKNADEVMYSNLFEMMHLFRKRSKLNVSIELILPIISSYSEVYAGIEKEFYDFSKDVFGFSIKEYSKILEKNGVKYDSVVKDMYSVDMIKDLLKKELHNSYIRCNYDTIRDYCYECDKCDVLFLSNADMKDHLFDKYQYWVHYNITRPEQLIKYYSEHKVFKKLVPMAKYLSKNFWG